MSVSAHSSSLPARLAHAAKPQSWPKLLVPAVLGQALGMARAGELSMAPLFVGLVFVLCDLLFIVYLNDWADQHVDATKRRMFPDSGSLKTIVDGIVPARVILLAGVSAGILAVLVAFVGGRLLGRPGSGWLGVLCLAWFAAYSLGPIRLNYRGGGELLEATGVGVVLPWFMAYLQSGQWLFPGLAVLAGFFCLSLASAVASGLADEESDREAGKTTVTTAYGNRAARRATELSLLVGAVVWIGVGALWPGVSPWAALAAGAWVLWQMRKLLMQSAAATTNAFDAHRSYKATLHAAIWGGAVVLSALVIVVRVLQSVD